jgi:hypothetical protein
MERVVQKGMSALKFLLQDRDPCVRVVKSEAIATMLNSCPTPGYHTTVPARHLCNGWSQLRQRPWSRVHGNPLFAKHTSSCKHRHRTAARVGYNTRKLVFARKYEERQRVSLRRINDNRAHCTSNVGFEVIRRGSCIIEWQVWLTFRVFRGHLEMVAYRRLTSAIAIWKVFRGHTQRVAYRRLTSVVAIQNVFRGHSLRVAYCLLRSAIDVQKFSEDIFVEKVRRIW